MNWFYRIFLIIPIITVCCFTSFALAETYYPDDGDFWYNGTNFADSYFSWSAPGGWATNNPGYEHDLALQSNYIASCTSITNLPYGYDDCPTAGWLEPSNLWTFSFGSYHAKKILAGRWYYGAWTLSHAWALSTNFSLNGQENYHGFCWWDSIWCMKGARSQPLLKGYLYWIRPLYGVW